MISVWGLDSEELILFKSMLDQELRYNDFLSQLALYSSPNAFESVLAAWFLSFPDFTPKWLAFESVLAARFLSDEIHRVLNYNEPDSALFELDLAGGMAEDGWKSYCLKEELLHNIPLEMQACLAQEFEDKIEELLSLNLLQQYFLTCWQA